MNMLKQILAASAVALFPGGCTSTSASGASELPQAGVAENQGLPAAAAAISALINSNHYNPNSLNDPAYRALEAQTTALGQNAQSREQFVSEFNALWRNGPFSHVNLGVARAGAEDTAAYLDQLRVGQGATLTWNSDIAVLTVSTMMGLDTIEQIDAAYAEIAERGATALVIDLRANDGGAFAVRPLVGHVIGDAFDAGAFVSQRWATEMSRPPTRADIATIAPWDGWSLRAFWRDVQDAPITRLRFTPVAPHYSGPVFVLISSRTASAAELAADALVASGRAVLIGETTHGRMLSQKPFDLPEGLQLFLPIADYYSFHSGRIEGAGVAPNIRVPAEQAMSEAMRRAAQLSPEGSP
jgi:carboxyl-terminal processing protease